MSKTNSRIISKSTINLSKSYSSSAHKAPPKVVNRNGFEKSGTKLKPVLKKANSISMTSASSFTSNKNYTTSPNSAENTEDDYDEASYTFQFPIKKQQQQQVLTSRSNPSSPSSNVNKNLNYYLNHYLDG